MTDTITPSQRYRVAAEVARERGLTVQIVADWEAEAARLEAEAARDEEAERYAKVQYEGEIAYAALEGKRFGPWEEASNFQRAVTLAGIRAVLDQLAADGRLLPEGGTEEAAQTCEDMCEDSHGGLVCTRLAGHPGRHVAHNEEDQPLLSWPATPPAVSLPLELPTEPGSRIRASVKRWGSAREWADTDPYVDTFTLGERDIWHAENDCLVVGAWNREYITVLEVLPAVSVPDSGPDGTPEKPWPTWQDVPEGVRYVSSDGCYCFVNRNGSRFPAGQAGESKFRSSFSDVVMDSLAPFVRADGDK
ncbi:hypothetical protein A6F59_16795 [Prescottella equi]|nr:hypothetical protein A6F59_16795 [Prescottella equi]